MKIAVPTTTIIAQHPQFEKEVAVLRSGKKHNGKLVLPGGRVKVGKHDFLQTGLIELEEEVGLEIISPKFFCISSNPTRDVRKVTLKKVADGGEISPELEPVVVEGHYCFDVAIYGKAKSTNLRPDGEESNEVFWYDLTTLNPEDFAIDHGTLLSLFADFLVTGVCPELGML